MDPRREKMTITESDVGTLDILGRPTDAAPKGPCVYLFRHQHAGIVTSHVFAKPPTAAQLAPMIAEAERLHGNRPGKDGAPPWHKVVEVELLANAVPVFPDRTGDGTKDNVASAPRVGIFASGTVTNPGEK